MRTAFRNSTQLGDDFECLAKTGVNIPQTAKMADDL
jgi:hypothetical protein